MSIVNGLGDHDTTLNERKQGPEADLVAWVMSRVDQWRDARDQAYQELWGEYYRLWRGRHIAADKSRASERSKLVSPALAQALEMSVAEMEEAVFGRENWVDLLPDLEPDEEGNLVSVPTGRLQQQLLQDLDKDNVPAAVADAFLNGGLFGTLAAKIVVEVKQERTIVTSQDPLTGVTNQTVDTAPYVCVKALPIPADELIVDPEATCTDEMLGVVHECTKSRAWLLQQPFGAKYAGGAGSRNADFDWKPERKDPEDLVKVNPNAVLVTEYHGLVPLRLLEAGNAPAVEEDPLAEAEVKPEGQETATGDFEGDGPMIEAIVTIFDKHFLARAVRNPFLMGDRSIVAAPFERVPGRFWGRGVMEKGYNPQKGLDAELRARMDALALITNPMVAADQTSLPRGFDLRVYPGKVWLTNGAPKESLMPFSFPGLDQASFAQTAEMERMVQMGTGAMDSATPIEANRRNETLGGTSMIASTFVKRTKRALRNINKSFLEPLVQRILWRRQQYDATRYPAGLKFRIAGTLGIVARELEQSQLTQLLSLVPPGSATQRVIIKAIFDNSNSPYKAELEAALEQDAQPDPMQQKLSELQMQAAEAEIMNKQLENSTLAVKMRLTEADTMLRMAQIQTELSKPGVASAELQAEFARLQIELGELAEFSRQNDITTFKAVADANKPQGAQGNGRARNS